MGFPYFSFKIFKVVLCLKERISNELIFINIFHFLLDINLSLFKEVFIISESTTAERQNEVEIDYGLV